MLRSASQFKAFGVCIAMAASFGQITFAQPAAPASTASTDPVATLYGTMDTEAGDLRFYWETRNWPEWLSGYLLKQRDLESDTWTALHPDAIAPTFSTERNWSNQGLSAEDVEELLTVRETTFASRIPERSAEEVLYLLIKANGLKSGDRLAQKLDFNVALFSGFGYLLNYDTESVDPLASEYGLFTVDKFGVDAESPISTWKAEAFSRETGAPEAIQIEVEEDIAVLKWSYSAETARERGLFGFHIYRKEPDATEWTSLTKTPLGSTESENGQQLFRFPDFEGNAQKDHLYAVVAANFFQQDFGRLEVAFEAERYRPLPLPEIVDHKTVNDADVFIEWNFPEEELERLEAFYIERGYKGQYERVSDALSSEIRTYADSSAKEYGEIYDYRVIAVDRWENEWQGHKTSLLYLGQSKPPTPANLTAQFLVQEGQPGILLQWDVQKTQNRRQALNRIVSDVTEPGNLLIQSYIEAFEGNRFFYPLKINGGRSVQVGVLPITEEGITGDPAVTEIYMPVLKLPPATGTQLTFDPIEYSAELKWDYPKDTEGLTGFRILVNGTPLPEGLEISSEERSIVISDERFEKGKTFNFSIVALGGLEDSNPSIAAPLWIRNDRLPKEVTAPEGLSVALVDEESEDLFAKLSWEPAADLEEAGLRGYALMVDYAQEGNVRRLNSLPILSGPEFAYKLPESEGRNAFTFRLAAVTLENELGPYTETILQLPQSGTEPTPDLSATP